MIEIKRDLKSIQEKCEVNTDHTRIIEELIEAILVIGLLTEVKIMKDYLKLVQISMIGINLDSQKPEFMIKNQAEMIS